MESTRRGRPAKGKSSEEKEVVSRAPRRGRAAKEPTPPPPQVVAESEEEEEEEVKKTNGALKKGRGGATKVVKAKEEVVEPEEDGEEEEAEAPKFNGAKGGRGKRKNEFEEVVAANTPAKRGRGRPTGAMVTPKVEPSSPIPTRRGRSSRGAQPAAVVKEEEEEEEEEEEVVVIVKPKGGKKKVEVVPLKMQLEICADNLESVVNAEQGGAHRLELCAALTEGGLTPTSAFMSMAKQLVKIPIVCMIRPRNGDFVYSVNEIKLMEMEIRQLKKHSVDGYVFGVLDKEGNIDEENCSRLLKAAGKVPCTFHRAFDLVSNPVEALGKIIELGFTRVLTSGQASSAQEGIPLIKELVDAAQGKISIMAGAGINTDNVIDIIKQTGVKEVHGSAGVLVRGAASKVQMGKSDNGDQYISSVEIVSNLKALIKNLEEAEAKEAAAKAALEEEASQEMSIDETDAEEKVPDQVEEDKDVNMEEEEEEAKVAEPKEKVDVKEEIKKEDETSSVENGNVQLVEDKPALVEKEMIKVFKDIEKEPNMEVENGKVLEEEKQD